ncbi:MAG: DUF5818 domain-containing protein [Planctomycetota bacterium]|jgi:hypothetical protein
MHISTELMTAAVCAGLLVTAPAPAQDTAVVTPHTNQEGFAGCGVLAFGPQTCVMLQADDGQAYALGHLGEFFIGDRVRVTGTVTPDSLLCWPAPATAIEDNTITACGAPVFGDLTGDGVVDFADVLVVISQWGPCAGCSADLDGSGSVDFGDVLSVISAWD